MATRVQIVIDCANPPKLAEFWAAALGYIPQPPPDGYDSWPDFLSRVGVPESEWGSRSAVIDPDGKGPRLFLQAVPEEKKTRNRVHLDLNIGGGPYVPLGDRIQQVDAEVERLLGLGATQMYVLNENGEYCVVMQDIEGNEFCVQ